MIARRTFTALAILALSGLLGLQPVQADMKHMHSDHPLKPLSAQSAKPKSLDVNILERDLVTQDGDPVKFKSEVIGDKLVIMDFIYTTCTTACPIQTAMFSQLQNLLGGRLGKEVSLISITIDPATDIPSRLKAYAKKHNAGPDWIFLTGKKSHVDEVLLGLRAYSSDLDEHPSMILVGDGKSDQWTRYYGFPKLDALLSKLDELQAVRDAHPVSSLGEK
ncbi:MAG: SCO family protein [Nitrospinaceae bacterium]